MELLYLCTYELNNPASLGVWKKMDAQRKVFAKHYDVSYTYMDRNHFYLKNDDLEIDLGELKFPGRIYCLKLLLNYYKKIGKVPDCMYVRYTMSDWNVIKLFSYLKKNGTKIIVEFPTYPYEDECQKNVSDKCSLLIDKAFRNKLRKYVICATSYGNVPSEIYGINSLVIQNGIDCSQIKKRVPSNDSNSINMLMVANFAPWHGCERLIDGLNDYYRSGGKREVKFYLVGIGDEIESYKKKVDDYGLCDRVLFCGFKKGAELEILYNLADIGVDALAGYKKNVSMSSSLKSKEYLASGLPIVFACDTDMNSHESDRYFLKVQNDNSKINLNTIIDFFDKIYGNADISIKKETVNRIASIGKKLCDIEVTMKPVIDRFS